MQQKSGKRKSGQHTFFFLHLVNISPLWASGHDSSPDAAREGLFPPSLPHMQPAVLTRGQHTAMRHNNMMGEDRRGRRRGRIEKWRNNCSRHSLQYRDVV